MSTGEKTQADADLPLQLFWKRLTAEMKANIQDLAALVSQ